MIVAVNGVRTVFERAVTDLAVRVVVAEIAGDHQPAFARTVFDLYANAGSGCVPAPLGFLGSLGCFNRFGPGGTVVGAAGEPYGPGRLGFFNDNILFGHVAPVLGQ
ncbi:hypothetical protein D3C87_1813420 [compost metagenome]